MKPNPRTRFTLPLAFLGALCLLGTHASFAATLVPAKEVVTPAPAAFVPPPLFGDWINPEINPIQDGTSKTKTTSVLPVVTSYGPFKIGENESPLPQDRVFATYNYYSDVLGTDFHRETLGMEKTILGGDASLGLRVPFSQFRGDFAVDDLSLIYKHKLLHHGGLTLSGGLAVTIPVNPYQPVQGGGDKYIPLLQPFAGYLWQRGDFFVQGFTSLGVPTDGVLPVMLFNDIGIGWNFQCGSGAIRAVVPTLEVHVNTPLTHRDAGDPERRRDSVDLTGGVHVQFGERTWLGLGVGTTVTDPRLFNVEALVSLNFRF